MICRHNYTTPRLAARSRSIVATQADAGAGMLCEEDGGCDEPGNTGAEEDGEGEGEGGENGEARECGA